MGRPLPRATEPVEQFFQFSLLGLLASGYCALAGSGALDLPTLVVTGAGLLLRLLLITGLVRLDIHPRWTTAATLLYIGFYPLDVMYLSREFIPATVHLICFLAVARVLTARTNRDYFFVKLIAFMQLVAATLLSDNLTFFVFLTLFVVFGVATFCCSEIRRASRSPERTVVGVARFHGKLAAVTGAITVGICLMTAGLFFLLPRTARAAFRSFVSERYFLPGFSNEITLGQIGELQQRNTPLMHILVEAPNDKLALKWRGSALSQFDGRRWYNPPGRYDRIPLTGAATFIAGEAQRRRDGTRVNYQVRVGQIDTDTVFFAGIPELVQMDGLRLLVRGPGDTYRTGFGSAQGRVYWATGHLPLPDSPPELELAPLSQDTFNEHLLLPGSTDRRIIELARAVGTGPTDMERARAIERHLRTRYGYTLDLLSEPVTDPLAHFLFTRKQGHCEYFASAMAVMLRSIHIPSRVVTGFQSGQFNPMTGWHVIRSADAHSWVEAWIAGRGWMTFDPTPPDGRGRQGLGMLWTQILLYLDAAETYWRQWVVDYDLERQIDLVTTLERRSRNLNSQWSLTAVQASAEQAAQFARVWAPWLFALLTAAVAAYIVGPPLWSRIQHWRHAVRISRGGAVASDAAVLYGRMLHLLRRRGIEKPAWLTPSEFARVIPAAHIALLVEQITAAYNDLRFGGKAEAGPRIVELLQQLETSPRRADW
jgi:protein-glutamine gamma-glutamyltransferase